MTVNMAVLRRRRIIQAAVETPVDPSVVSLPAVLTQRGTPTTGDLRYTGMLWLPPTGVGSLAEGEEHRVAFWRDGSEIPVHVEAGFGRHWNGKLNQLRYDLNAIAPDSMDIPIEVRIGAPRTVTDRTRRTIMEPQFRAKRWVAITDPTFLCRTWATGMPLVPISEWSAPEIAWFKTMADAAVQWRDDHAPGKGPRGAATYNISRVFVALYCCTGDPKYLHNAHESAARWLDTYHMPVGSDPYGGYGASAQVDPENLGRYAEAFAEQYSICEWDYELLYGLTGWPYPWNYENHVPQRIYRSGPLSATSLFAGTLYGMRFNLRELRHLGAAIRLNATRTYADPDYPARDCDFVAEFPRIFASMVASAYDDSAGAYRNGMIGQSKLTENNSVDPAWGAGTGDHPTFWLSIPNDYNIDTYHTILADPAIIDRVAINFGVAMANMGTLPSLHYYRHNYPEDGEKWAVPYRCTSTPNPTIPVGAGPTSLGDSAEPFDCCMHSKAAGFLMATRPDQVFSGKSAEEWFTILTKPGQMSGMEWNDKFIAETLQAFGAMYYKRFGDPGGPSVIRSPIIHTGAPT